MKSPIAQFISRNGATYIWHPMVHAGPNVQLHAKAMVGGMERLNEDDFERGDMPWNIVGPSAFQWVRLLAKFLKRCLKNKFVN